MKKLLSVLLILCMIFVFSVNFNVSSASAAVPTDYAEIIPGNPQEVSITDSEEITYFRFVPTETGWYKYYSDGYVSVQGTIMDCNYNKLAGSDNYQQYMGRMEIYGNFSMTYYFYANRVYLLASQTSSNYAGKYNVDIFKVQPATVMQLGNSETYNGYIGGRNTMRVSFVPENCEPETISWSSANTDIVEIDNQGKMYFKALGTTTITATTENGLTDSIEVVVNDRQEILENTVIESMAGGSGHSEWYKFVPKEDGNYAYKIEGGGLGISVSGKIYDKNLKELATTDRTADSIINYNMSAGETYYILYETYSGCIFGVSYLSINKIGNITNPDEGGIDRTDDIWQTGEEIVFEDIKEIYPEQEKMIGITYRGAKSLYKFTPKEDGEYKFYALSDKYISLNVYNDKFEKLKYGRNNEVVYALKAGETYIFESELGDPYALDSYVVGIERLPDATDIHIANGEKISDYLGNQIKLELKMTPEECQTEKIRWSTSDKNIVEVDDGTISLIEPGIATITATNESGLTASIIVEVLDYTHIEEGREFVIREEDLLYYKFVPEVSGVYKFEGKSNSDKFIVGSILNNKFKEKSSDKGKDEFSTDCKLEAGKAYYLNVKDLANYPLKYVEVAINLERILGDVNDDSKINAEDALLVLKYSAKIIELERDYTNFAEVTFDDKINSQDALEILKYSAQLPSVIKK